MADKKTIEKVKELIDSNAYAPLKETAKKWLAAADEKYGDKFDDLKEKAAPALDKLGDAAEKYSDFAIDANEKLKGVSDKVAEGTDKLKEKAGPAIGELKEKAAPVVDKAVDKVKEKAAPVVDKALENEFIAQLKDSVSTLKDNIEFFGSDEAKRVFGEEAAEQIRKHSEELKAEGKTYCDCPACTKAREILRDMGVELEAE